MGKPQGKRRPRHRREDNIKTGLLDRSGSGQGQVAGTCECSNEPPGSIKCREFLG